jgi:hypothetical protein
MMKNHLSQAVFIFVAAVSAELFFSGCLFDSGSKSKSKQQPVLVKAELMRVEFGEAAGPVAKRFVGTLSTHTIGLLPLGSSDFEILSLRVPLRSVRITSQDGTQGFAVYECTSGANDGCLVDLASGTALQDLLNGEPLPVPPGEFSRILIDLCGGTETNTMYMSGEVMLDGQHRYTRADGSLSTSGPAEEAPLTLQECHSVHELIEKIVIAAPEPPDVSHPDLESLAAPEPASQVIPVRLYYDLDGLASGGITGYILQINSLLSTVEETVYDTVVVHRGRGSCSIGGEALGTQTDATYFCLMFPGIAGTVGTAYPIPERYLIDSLVKMTMYFSAIGDKPLAAYAHVYDDWAIPDSNYWISGVATSYAKFEDLGGGNYHLEGRTLSEDHPKNPGVPWPHFPVFRRETHSGTIIGHYLNETYPYTAVKLP